MNALCWVQPNDDETLRDEAEEALAQPDMQKDATKRPLVAEIFSDCGRIKAGIPLKMWKNLNE